VDTKHCSVSGYYSWSDVGNPESEYQPADQLSWFSSILLVKSWDSSLKQGRVHFLAQLFLFFFFLFLFCIVVHHEPGLPHS